MPSNKILIDLDNFGQAGDVTCVEILADVHALSGGESANAANLVRDMTTGKLVRVEVRGVLDNAVGPACDKINANKGVSKCKSFPFTEALLDFEGHSEGLDISTVTGWVVGNNGTAKTIAAAAAGGSNFGLENVATGGGSNNAEYFLQNPIAGDYSIELDMRLATGWTAGGGREAAFVGSGAQVTYKASTLDFEIRYSKDTPGDVFVGGIGSFVIGTFAKMEIRALPSAGILQIFKDATLIFTATNFRMANPDQAVVNNIVTGPSGNTTHIDNIKIVDLG